MSVLPSLNVSKSSIDNYFEQPEESENPKIQFFEMFNLHYSKPDLFRACTQFSSTAHILTPDRAMLVLHAGIAIGLYDKDVPALLCPTLH